MQHDMEVDQPIYTDDHFTKKIRIKRKVRPASVTTRVKRVVEYPDETEFDRYRGVFQGDRMSVGRKKKKTKTVKVKKLKGKNDYMFYEKVGKNHYGNLFDKYAEEDGSLYE